MYERYAQVLHECKNLATINVIKQPKDVNVTHHMTTKSLPTVPCVLRLAGDKLLAAKKKFE